MFKSCRYLVIKALPWIKLPMADKRGEKWANVVAKGMDRRSIDGCGQKQRKMENAVSVSES